MPIWFTKQNIIIAIMIAVLLAIYFLLLAHPVNLVTADLGRHIKNGEHFIQNFEVIKSNFYSFTNPDFFTTNHHWGAGAVFYLVWLGFGIAGVHVLFIALSLLTLYVFYLIARKRVGVGVAVVLALLVLPLLNQRTELRPEVISYLFTGVFIYFLLRFRSGDYSFKKMLWLLVFQVLWVNSHIYFFLGLAITGAFLLESLIRERFWGRGVKQLGGLLLLLAGASFINPFGVAGALAPFTIFEHFGYQLYENQTPLFVENLFPERSFLYFKVMFALLVLSFITSLAKDWRRVDLANLFLATGFSWMAWAMIRNHTLFGFVFIPILAINFRSIIPLRFQNLGVLKKISLGLASLIFLLTLSGELAKVFPYRTDFGLGTLEGNDDAAEFFKMQQITGPIFNNYDNGGYLIFHLYPDDRVFVDNRPEAYPESFFQNLYIPMQQDDDIWAEQLQKYDFNTIFFSHRDFTPWGQQFLVSRVQDSEWAPVFVDDFSIIFLRRSRQNQSVIEDFEISEESFNIIR